MNKVNFCACMKIKFTNFYPTKQTIKNQVKDDISIHCFSVNNNLTIENQIPKISFQLQAADINTINYLLSLDYFSNKFWILTTFTI